MQPPYQGPSGQQAGQIPHDATTYRPGAPLPTGHTYTPPHYAPPPPFSQAPGTPLPPGSAPGRRPAGPPMRKGVPVPLVVLAVLGALLFGYIGGNASPMKLGTSPDSSSGTKPAITQLINQSPLAPAPTPTATPNKKWVTLKTFTGTGNKTTEIFTVGERWRIVWECKADEAPLYIHILKPDGTAFVGRPSTICKASGTKDNSEVHKIGKVYLDVISGIEWTITIQEWK